MAMVAAEAKVATSTVSRFLAGNLRLGTETEARIRSAVEQLGYTKSSTVSTTGLDDARATLVAIVVSDLVNGYYAAFAEHTARSIEAAGYSPVTISVSSTAPDPLAGIAALIQAGLAGVISIGATHSSDLRAYLDRNNVPLVTVEERHETGGPSSLDVDLDNYSGARQAITYLTRLGHRNIAFISGPRDLAPVAARRHGYEDGLRAEGIDFEEQFDLEGERSEDFGFAALTKLLAYDRVATTAVFVAADEIAVGLVNAAMHMKVRIPDELSVVGFDDIRAASHVSPRLTTIHTPLVKLADVAAAGLLNAIAHGRRNEALIVPVSLVVRESTAPHMV